jgi:hypothetical protein
MCCDKRSSLVDQLSKDTWHNQMMTSVKMKLAFQVHVNHESK